MSSAPTMEPVPQDTKKDIAPDGIDPVGHVITYAESPGGTARDVAYPERELPPGGAPAYLEARKGGARSFVLWADPQRRTRLATLVTTSAAGWGHPGTTGGSDLRRVSGPAPSAVARGRARQMMPQSARPAMIGEGSGQEGLR
ncbi:hypothetical protein [Streptomyces sp. NBC_01579]|uniref:hypothetical protein n=1 Tax=unclassified Streptomyces TaxID=2593676 RepID=UPI00386E1CA1